MVYLIGNEAALAIDHRSTSFPGAAASSGVTDRINTFFCGGISLICGGTR